jgi:DNA-binding NarL/FixJ family response regulator
VTFLLIHNWRYFSQQPADTGEFMVGQQQAITPSLSTEPIAAGSNSSDLHSDDIDRLSGADVLNKLTNLQPDLILMDIHMPGENGIDVTRRIKAQYPDMIVLILTMFEDDKSVFAAMRAGASGYVLKGIKLNEMLQTLRVAATGGAVFSPRIAGHIMQWFAQMQTVQPESVVELPQLSRREHDILALIAAGDDNPTIAEKLTLSPKTVRNYVSQVLTKLAVSDRMAAAKKARQAGIE